MGFARIESHVKVPASSDSSLSVLERAVASVAENVSVDLTVGPTSRDLVYSSPPLMGVPMPCTTELAGATDAVKLVVVDR